MMYVSYEPLTVTITHILNNKSGINFASYAHTGLPVEVFAMGAGQEQFEKWTVKLADRDWAALERIWSNANSAPGGEVMK